MAQVLLNMVARPTAMAYRILVADDSEPNLQALLALLQGPGFEIEAARDGSLALRLLLDGNFDLSLLDVHMPQLTGIQVVCALRQVGRPVPSILMTGHPSGALEMAAMEAGAIAMLRKPIPAELLRITIQRVLTPSPGPPASRPGPSGGPPPGF